MQRWPIRLALLGMTALSTGTALAAAVENPASPLLPPVAAGNDLSLVPAPAQPGPASPSAPAAPVAPGISVQRLGDRLLIAIGVAGASAVKLTQTGSEVLLAFPRALPPFNGQAVLDQAKGLLEGLSVGYDTLLLQLAPGITVARNDAANGIRIALQPGGRAAEPELADAGERRLRLLDAQLTAQEGDTAGSRAKLEALLPEMKGSPEALSAIAGVDAQLGRWRLALSEYRQALQLDPGNPAIEGAIAAIDRQQGSRLRTDLEYRQTDGGLGTGRATAVIEGLSGHQLFGDGWRIGFTSDLAQIDASSVQRVNGLARSFSGTRGRTEVYLQYDTLGGDSITGSLFSNGDTVGGGVHAELPDATGVTLLRAEYRRPDWDFFQSIVNGGTRDRLSLGRRQQFGSDLTGRLEVGVNRYSVTGESDVDRTVSVTGELRLGRLAGVRGLSVAYVLDGEYLFRQVERAAPGGGRFNPLQLLDREVHALTLSYAGAVAAGSDGGQLTYEFTGGYGADRYGKAGPLLAAVFGYSVGSFDLRLRANYVENIGRSRGSTQVYGLTLAWVF